MYEDEQQENQYKTNENKQQNGSNGIHSLNGENKIKDNEEIECTECSFLAYLEQIPIGKILEVGDAKVNETDEEEDADADKMEFSQTQNLRMNMYYLVNFMLDALLLQFNPYQQMRFFLNFESVENTIDSSNQQFQKLIQYV